MGFGPPGGIAGAGLAGGIYWGKGKKERREERAQGRQAGEGKGLGGLLRGGLRKVLGQKGAKQALGLNGSTGVSWDKGGKLGGRRGWGPWWERDPKSGDGGALGGTCAWGRTDRQTDTRLGTPPINPRKRQVRTRRSLPTADSVAGTGKGCNN